MTRYTNHHVSQYCPGCSSITRSSGCTWTSARNGADAATGGKVNKTPDQVHALVKNSEETSPSTPGWSLGDVNLAMSRLGVGFEDRSHTGWAGVVKAHDAGFYIILQGDSDQFPDTTCSGNFNGDHAIGVHPNEDAGRWRIDDPICLTARYESEARLRAYAEKLDSKVRFGVFTTPVPIIPPDTATEDAMLLTSAKALTGTATLITAWGLWDVATDNKSAAVAKGTTFDVLGSVIYHKSKANPDGFTGYLVNHSGRLHVLPSKDVSKFVAKSATYPVTVGGKAAGSVTLP
jgi:hypothetical protein